VLGPFDASGDCGRVSPRGAGFQALPEKQTQIVRVAAVVVEDPAAELTEIGGLFNGERNCAREGVHGVNGSDFSMQYCWLIRVVDGWITEIIGFYDSKKMNDLFA
jgi:hypothetical protein